MECKDERRIVRTGNREFDGGRRWLWSGDYGSLDWYVLQARNRLGMVLEPVQKNGIIAILTCRNREAIRTADRATGRKVRVIDESLGFMRSCEVGRVLAPVQVQEWRREHSGH